MVCQTFADMCPEIGGVVLEDDWLLGPGSRERVEKFLVSCCRAGTGQSVCNIYYSGNFLCLQAHV